METDSVQIFHIYSNVQLIYCYSSPVNCQVHCVLPFFFFLAVASDYNQNKSIALLKIFIFWSESNSKLCKKYFQIYTVLGTFTYAPILEWFASFCRW